MVTCGGRRPAVLSVAQAANLGVFDALILTGSPVCGLPPVRAARLDTENQPKPIATSSPFFGLLATVVVREFTARVSSARDSHIGVNRLAALCARRPGELVPAGQHQHPTQSRIQPRTQDGPVAAEIDFHPRSIPPDGTSRRPYAIRAERPKHSQRLPQRLLPRPGRATANRAFCAKSTS